MKYILFIIPSFGMIGSYLYFDYKLSIARKQQMIASNQYTTLREDYKKLANNISKTKLNSTNLSIKFSTPISKTGITKPNVSLYLAPLNNSPVIKNINIRMEANILDSALLNSETWFYVALPIDTDINCRGWINKDDFSVLYSNSKNISKSY